MTKFSSKRTKSQIIKFCEDNGLEYSEAGSNLSSSCYLTISANAPDWTYEHDAPRWDEPWPVKIRIANHVQRPTYYQPAIELGNHENGFENWRDSPLPGKLAVLIAATRAQAPQ